MGSRLSKRQAGVAKVQGKLAAARLRPVKLRLAAALLHHELGGDTRSSLRGPEYIRQLCAAAATLAGVLDLYWLDRTRVVPIAKSQLAQAEFLDGGNVVRTAAGTLYRPLAVRRAEAIAAIEALVTEKIET
jgi:hypothetical protein